MADPAQALREGRSMREAARRLLDSDMAALRGSVRGHGERVRGQMNDHQLGLGIGLALAGGGLAAWLLRAPLARFIERQSTAAKSGAMAQPDEGEPPQP